MIPEERLARIADRHAFLEARLNAGLPPRELGPVRREYAALSAVIGEVAAYRRLLAEIAGAEAMLGDAELGPLAAEELARLRRTLPAIEAALETALLPRDDDDDRPAILEIRAGTGGDEAALFAADLARMYQRCAEKRGWGFAVIEAAPTPLGGFREFVAEITGANVFAALRFESGVHRVQRVPDTEAGGRIHTSAASVAVLPEAEETEIDIPPEDLRIDTMRASGAGGQHVNKTDSAVRITHLPTGIVVTSSEKSQHQNRARAMQVLKARLYDMERSRAAAERAADRRGQIGSGDRSERVRTYNFPQGRVTDHRINLTLYQLDQILDGELGPLTQGLRAAHEAERLAEAGP
jgi:peptide chain release factor 1